MRTLLKNLRSEDTQWGICQRQMSRVEWAVLTQTDLRKFMLCFFILIFGAAGCQKENALRQSEAFLEAGKLQEAVALLEKIVAEDERNTRARWLLGDTYDKLGRYNDAISALKTASHQYSGQPEARIKVRMQLATVYLKLGDRASAFSELRSVVRSTSDDAVLRQVTSIACDMYKVVQLTKDNSDNYSPIFSPDSSLLAFSSFRLENGELYLMDITGRIRQRVTFTTDFNESSPAFLSNPHYIFYSSEPKTSRQVKIVVQSSGSTPIFAGFNVTHIYSKVTQQVLPVKFGVRAPRLSPDRKQIVYESNTDGNLELYLLDLSNIDLMDIAENKIEPKRITHNDVDDGSPAFFPDGKRIVFISSREKVHQIYTINVNGDDEKHLNPNPYDCYSPVVSTDGRTIVFVSTRDGDREVYMMDADGTNERRITNGIGVSMQPALSPDGTKLAFVSDRSDTFQIYLMLLDQPITHKELFQRLQSPM